MGESLVRLLAIATGVMVHAQRLDKKNRNGITR